MRAYYSLFRIRMMKGLQYRIPALAGVLTQFFWGFMYVMIFEAFYKSTSAAQPIAYHELIQVIWLQQGFLFFIMFWYRDSELMNMIANGNIAYELCRPLNLYSFWYVKLLAQRLSGALLRCFPILIVAMFLPYPYNLTLPSSPLVMLLFVVTLSLGLLLMVAITMLIYISVFYTMNGTGSILIFGVIGEFFSGMVIPVPLMPETLKRIVYVFPFRYTSDLPFRIYAGNIGFREGLLSILVQLFWLTLISLLGRWWMGKALKRVVVQGG